MEKMKQECKVKKPLKIWQGVLPVWHVWKFARRASSVWGGSGGCPFVPGGSAGGVSA